MSRSWMVLVAGLVGCGGVAAEERIVVSPGRVADEELKADDTSGPKAEVKVTVAADAIDATRDDLGLTLAIAEEREVWFYDSAALELFEAGAILRARKVVNDDDDATVKLRPLEASDVDPSWFDVKGFKCELDWTPGKQVSSCSIKVDAGFGDIKNVADGDLPIADLFTEEQVSFLAAHGPAVDWDYLTTFGPIEAFVWEIESDALPEELSAELWRVGGEQFLEMSMKIEVSEIDDTFDVLSTWLADHAVPLSDTQETKTRRALEILGAAGP